MRRLLMFLLWPPQVDDVLAWADRHRYWLYAGVGLLLVAGYSPAWNFGNDTSMYAAIARNLAEGHGFVHPSGFEREAALGLPYLWSMQYRLLGEQGIWLSNLAMLGCAALVLVVSHALVRSVATRPIAVGSTVLLGLSSNLHDQAYSMTPDMPFLLGLMLFLLGMQRLSHDRPRWHAGLLLAGGLVVMALTRTVVIIVIAAVVCTWGVRLVIGPHRRRYALGCMALLLVVIVSRFVDPRLEAGQWLNADERHAIRALVDQLPQTVERIGDETLPYMVDEAAAEGMLGEELTFYGGAVFCVVLLGVVVMLFRARLLWGMLAVLFIVQWLLFLPLGRYFLALQPLLVFGWLALARQCNRWFGTVHGARIGLGMIIFYVIINLVAMTGTKVDQWERTLAMPAYPDYTAHQLVGTAIGAGLPTDAVILVDVKKTSFPLAYFARRTVFAVDERPPGWEQRGPCYIMNPDRRMLDIVEQQHGLTPDPTPVLELVDDQGATHRIHALTVTGRD